MEARIRKPASAVVVTRHTRRPVDFIVAVAGSRTFNDYRRFRKALDTDLADLHREGYRHILLTSEDAGVDILTRVYAEERGYQFAQQPAKGATMLIAFWDGFSKGTMRVINTCALLRQSIHGLPSRYPFRVPTGRMQA